MKDWNYCFLRVVTRHLALAIPQTLCSSSLLLLLEAARVILPSEYTFFFKMHAENPCQSLFWWLY
jgi:hypothetical protein